MKKNMFYCLLSLCLFGNARIFGQSATVAGGGDTANATGSVSYSIGQPFSEFTKNSTGSVQPGVQQPYVIEITKITPEWERAKIDVFFAYPNPTSGVLTLKFTGDVLQNFSFVLYDMNGKMMVQKMLTDKETQIDMSGLKSGNYVLRVLQGGKEIAVMKIIKS